MTIEINKTITRPHTLANSFERVLRGQLRRQYADDAEFLKPRTPLRPPIRSKT
jgi:hypothetical protein